MKTDAEREELDRLTERVIGCAYEVSNTLGCGFLEKVYENALAETSAPYKIMFGWVCLKRIDRRASAERLCR